MTTRPPRRISPGRFDADGALRTIALANVLAGLDVSYRYGREGIVRQAKEFDVDIAPFLKAAQVQTSAQAPKAAAPKKSSAVPAKPAATSKVTKSKVKTKTKVRAAAKAKAPKKKAA